MNPISRGIRNAFRNILRTSSIVFILGLSMGLALTMLIANKAVSSKITSIKSSLGNTVSITPAGFSSFSSVNNSLTTSQLESVTKIPHVTSVTENLTDRLTTIGSQQPSFGFGNSSNTNTNNQTSLSSPVTINLKNSGGGRLFITGGSTLPTNFSPPITVLGTNDPYSISGQSITLKSGSMINPNTAATQAIISSSMASKNNLKVGSTFSAYSQNLTVDGIFNDTTQAANNTVVVSLPELQQLTTQSGAVTSATAYVDSIDNLNNVTSEIKSSLGSSADVVNSVTEANNDVQTLNSVKTLSSYSLIGAIIAGAVIILLTMMMIVRERAREIGVIKAIGGSNFKITTQFISEAATLTLLGAVIGLIIAVIGGSPITKLLVNNSSSSTTSAAPGAGGGGGFAVAGGGGGGGATPRVFSGGRGAFGGVRNNITNIHANIGWGIIADGAAAAIIISVVGSGSVSYFISKVRPAEVLRSD